MTHRRFITAFLIGWWLVVAAPIVLAQSTAAAISDNLEQDAAIVSDNLGQNAAIVSDSQQQTIPLYLDDSQPLERRIDDALARMTLEEKVALCHAQGKFSSAGVPRLGIPELWWSDGPHGVRYEINWNNWGSAQWTADSVTAFPALTCLAATWNTDLAYRYGQALGEEARYRKKDIILGPGVNIYRTPLNGRNFEYMGEDPALAAAMAVPYIRGVQEQGVAVSVKHFALNNQELWRGHIDVQLSDRALHEIYLPAFRAAVQEGGAWTVMGSYNKVRGEHGCQSDLLLNKILRSDWGFDGVVVSDWGGVHSTLLAAEHGVDVEMGSYTNGLTSESSFTFNDYFLAKPYLNMLQSGQVALSTVDDKARRILRLIFRTAMNRQRPYGALCTDSHYATARKIGTEGIVLLKNEGVSSVNASSNVNASSGVNASSSVNVLSGVPLLPIDGERYDRILVVGDNAVRQLTNGGGSSELKVKDYISPLQALTDLYGSKVMFAQGYRAGRPMYSHVEEIPQTVQDSLRQEAVTMARSADLIIYIGGLNKNSRQDCEAADRDTYALPFAQDQLIEALVNEQKPMVVVIVSGNAVEMPWIDSVPAVVQNWYLGTMGGLSLADILSGATSPSGKLPFSIPKRLTDCGAHAFDTLCYPGDSITEIYREDILVGYRWHDTKHIPALFPFGHGLNYTTFQYGTPTITADTSLYGTQAIAADASLYVAPTITANAAFTISLPITNTGSVTAKEVAQLYVSQDHPTVLRPQKELKHFQKITLAPGETKTITFHLTAADLAYYHDNSDFSATNTNASATTTTSTSTTTVTSTLPVWRTDSGSYTILIGSSSIDIRQQAQLYIAE